MNTYRPEYIADDPQGFKELVIADGVDWNPDGTSGPGKYYRNEANSAWVFLG